jgi:hypothetical protein
MRLSTDKATASEAEVIDVQVSSRLASCSAPLAHLRLMGFAVWRYADWVGPLLEDVHLSLGTILQ